MPPGGCPPGCVGLAGGCGCPGYQPQPPQVGLPYNGQLFPGPTSELTIPIDGLANGSAVTVQIMDPTQNGAWVTVGAAQVQTQQQFWTTIGPFSAAQFPQGGMLALRVLDDHQQPIPYGWNNDESQHTTLVIASPAESPDAWTYPTAEPANGSATAAYYANIAAPATLADFASTYALSTGVRDVYYHTNAGVVGRDLACATDVGVVACTVAEIGAFQGDEAETLSQLAGLSDAAPSETFAMVYDPAAAAGSNVAFIVYDADGNLRDSANLDASGTAAAVPQACLSCHGIQATFDAGSAQLTGGQFLTLDPRGLDFPQGGDLTFSYQADPMYRLTEMLEATPLSPTQRAIVAQEWTPSPYGMGDGDFWPDFVPDAWGSGAREQNLYIQVIEPFCRGCHASATDDSSGLAFATAAEFQQNADQIIADICSAGPHGMPGAPATAARLFAGIAPGCNELGANSELCQPEQANPIPTGTTVSARALILEYLGHPEAAATCGQGQPQP